MAAKAPDLRPYQRDVIERVWASFEAGQRRVLLVAPTASGKTVIAGELIRDAVGRGMRILFLDHRRELTSQASRKIHAVGVDHGIIQAGFQPRPGERVQVAAVQTLHARAVRSSAMEMPPADVILVDEGHHIRARTYRRILEAYPNAIIIGLTATPCRGDGRGLGNVFDMLVESASVAELTALGFLVSSRIYAPTRPDLSGIKTQHGDYHEGQLAERVDTAKLVGDIVEHWHRLAERRRAVVFATGVAHSVHLRDEFRRSGVMAEHIDGSTPIEERDAILARLAAGTVEVVCNAMVLTEGWDCPEVACLVLARPTKSLGLYRQMVGRVLRPAPGKVDALILDHAGAVFAHGFPDDPIKWTLREDKRAENKAHAARNNYQAPALTTCPECAAVRFEGKPCPVCGWRPRPKAKPVAVADGDLGHVDRQRHVAAAALDRLQFYRELLWIANNRQYKPAWAAYKFQDKFGSMPPWEWLCHPPVSPSDATLSWVHSRNIAYAKSLQKAGAA